MEGQRRRLRYTTKLVLQTQKHHIKSYEDAWNCISTTL
jgi:hypothetical protein